MKCPLFARLIPLLILGVGISGAAPKSTTASSEPKPSATRRLVVISVDGFQPRFYRDANFGMTFLSLLAKKGLSFNKVKPVFPSVTYPSHTTIVTGVPPAVHGIIANAAFNFEKAEEGEWFFESEKIRAKTIFKSIRDQKMKLALLHWPVSRGADGDWVIPEILVPPTFSITEAWEPTIKESLPKNWLANWIKDQKKKSPTTIEEEDAILSDAAIELLDKTDVRVLFVHFTQIDLLQHRAGPNAKALPAALRVIDQMIKRIAAKLDLKRDTLVVLGDHGFSPTRKALHLNALFKVNGLYPKAAAHATGGSAAIYLKDPEFDIPLMNFLKRESKRGYRIYSKKDLDRLQGFPSAFAAVEALPGTELLSKSLGPDIETPLETEGGTHGASSAVESMHTGLMIIGHGINGLIKPEVREEASLLDVAATLASLLKLDWQTGQTLLQISGSADKPSHPSPRVPAAGSHKD